MPLLQCPAEKRQRCIAAAEDTRNGFSALFREYAILRIHCGKLPIVTPPLYKLLLHALSFLQLISHLRTITSKFRLHALHLCRVILPYLTQCLLMLLRHFLQSLLMRRSHLFYNFSLLLFQCRDSIRLFLLQSRAFLIDITFQHILFQPQEFSAQAMQIARIAKIFLDSSVDLRLQDLTPSLFLQYSDTDGQNMSIRQTSLHEIFLKIYQIHMSRHVAIIPHLL